MTPALYQLLEAVRTLHNQTPALRDFAPFPGDLAPGTSEPQRIPATDQVAAWSLPGTADSAPVVQAIRAAAQDICWVQTYTAEEVGQYFLDHYGYFELYGPTGLFISDEARAYVSYWDRGLDYGWHHHQPEELYYILAGEAEFFAEGMATTTLTPGDTRLHLSDQRHAMTTHTQPILTYVVWRGDNITDLPKMSAE